MNNLNGGGSAHELWCVELVPKLKKLSGADKEEAVRFAKGIPSDPDRALVWLAQALTGLEDNRTADFARVRQRLVVFKEKARAAERARRETNEYWSGKVPLVKIFNSRAVGKETQLGTECSPAC